MSGLTMWAGPIIAAVVVGFAVWLAVHTVSSRWRAKVGDMLLPGRFRSRGKLAHRFTAGTGSAVLGVAAAGAAAQNTAGWWWIGVAVFWGCLAHTLGDALTFSAVPLWWPLRIRGCRWAKVGTPRWARFRTGSPAETVVVWVLSGVGVCALWLLVQP